MLNFTRGFEALKDSIIGVVLLLALAIIGLIWLSIGIYSWLVSLMGPVFGPLALGGLCLLPLVIYVINQSFKRPARPESLTPEAASVLHIAKIIESLSSRSPLLGTAAAIAAGFLALLAQILAAWAQDSHNKKP
jgi:hypothetical protein